VGVSSRRLFPLTAEILLAPTNKVVSGFFAGILASGLLLRSGLKVPVRYDESSVGDTLLSAWRMYRFRLDHGLNDEDIGRGHCLPTEGITKSNGDVFKFEGERPFGSRDRRCVLLTFLGILARRSKRTSKIKPKASFQAVAHAGFGF